MDLNLVTIDISSDDEEVGCDKTDSWCDSYDLLSDFLDEGWDDYDQVTVIGEVKSNKRASYVDDECVILEGDPDNRMAEVNDSSPGGADELLIVGQKGQIACRDYPHPRSICAKFPFGSTPHERHCDMCHCYVCESPAPCAHWGTGIFSVDHCHATNVESWKLLRRDFKELKTMTQLPPKIVPPLTPKSYPISTNYRCPASSISQQSQSLSSIIQCYPRHSLGISGPRPSSSHPKFKSAAAGSVSAHQSNRRGAAHQLQYFMRHLPVSAKSHRNHANGLFHHPDTNSESGTYQRSYHSNLDNSSGGHRGQQQRRQSCVGGLRLQSRGRRYMSRNQTRRAMDSRFPPFISDYDC